MVYVKHVEVLHIVEDDKVRLISRSDRSYCFEAIALSGIDGRHFDCLKRIEAKLNSSSDVIDNMAFPEDIFDMLVIGAEAEVFGIDASPYDTADNVVNIVSG